jgi:hypothetical protein
MTRVDALSEVAGACTYRVSHRLREPNWIVNCEAAVGIELREQRVRGIAEGAAQDAVVESGSCIIEPCPDAASIYD